MNGVGGVDGVDVAALATVHVVDPASADQAVAVGTAIEVVGARIVFDGVGKRIAVPSMALVLGQNRLLDEARERVGDGAPDAVDATIIDAGDKHERRDLAQRWVPQRDDDREGGDCRLAVRIPDIIDTGKANGLPRAGSDRTSSSRVRSPAIHTNPLLAPSCAAS